MTEEAIIFGGERSLVGVLTLPEGTPRMGIVFPNAGLIHHVGPGRLFVELARVLAAEGIASLRFDLSGIGDSPRRQDPRSVFELSIDETRAAVDRLRAAGVSRVGIFGLCSGAYAARHVAATTDVDAIWLVNPQDLVPGSNLLERSWKRRYLTNSVFRLQSWRNLLSGKANTERLLGVFLKKPSAPSAAEAAFSETVDAVHDQLAAMAGRGCAVNFVLSERDPSVDEVGVFLGTDLRAGPSTAPFPVQVVRDADHLFLAPGDKRALLETIMKTII